MATDSDNRLPSERARRILRALVEQYIRDGQPVGSRTLSRSTGLDLSPDALALAKENIADYGLADRVRVVESDLFAALGSERFDLILCNPPYVDAPAMASLPPEYRHEPVMALASGPDGLDFVRRLLRASRRRLKPRGVLVVEVGHNAGVLEQAFPNLAFTWLETHAGPRHVFLMTRDDLPDG